MVYFAQVLLVEVSSKSLKDVFKGCFDFLFVSNTLTHALTNAQADTSFLIRDETSGLRE